MKALMSVDTDKLLKLYEDAKKNNEKCVIKIIERVAKIRGIDLNAEKDLESDKE